MRQRRQQEVIPPETTAHKSLVWVWRFLRSLLVLMLSAMILVGAGLIGYNAVKTHYFDPVSDTDDAPILVDIPRGSSISTIGAALEEAGVVRNGKVFKYYIEFSGYASKMKAGSYVFNATMTMQEIMEKLAKGDGRGNVTSFIVIEGMTIDEMAASLYKQGVISSVPDFQKLCEDADKFAYNFAIAQLTEEQVEERVYALEGYLFPATYEIYVGSSMETIIEKMLTKFSSVMTQERIDRAAELNLSVDDVVILASIIEKEAKPDDFAKVSAVFHNRLERGMKLQSDATVQYVLGTKKFNLTGTDISVESPYNTYLVDGLPAGPLCSPSEKAIDAVLYPDESFIADGYLYFVSKDPESGELEFNITAEGHEASVEKYRPLWEAFDEKQAQENENAADS